ncbi:MAG: phage virion morphogenesis protein [Prevotellaceae bacterium]|jgi:phage gpG-like protein|nr:phage virion morphogenesis protein [Prevotellaceae bacterium]
MTPEEFQQELKRLETQFKYYSKNISPIIGKVAVDLFKQNFKNEGFFGEHWKEVKRREASSGNFKTIQRGEHKGQTEATNAFGRRKILTGATGDLGRSIQYKVLSDGVINIFTNPAVFGKEPYARVHNEGLKAGRGSGFTMPKRQFIGDHPQLRQAIIDKLTNRLTD